MDPGKRLLFFFQVYVAIPLPSPHLYSRSPTLTHLQQLLIAKMAQGKHTYAPKRQKYSGQFPELRNEEAENVTQGYKSCPGLD
jgi:hypothetical protein